MKENSVPKTNIGVNTQSNTINLTWQDLSQSMSCSYSIPLDPLLASDALHRLRKILELVKTVSARVTVSKDIPEDLVCENSKIVLVGDAAHPSLVNKAWHRIHSCLLINSRLPSLEAITVQPSYSKTQKPCDACFPKYGDATRFLIF